MAYHFFIVGKTTHRLRRGYNLDYAVGQGGRNALEDVMLLQTLLRMLYIENTSTNIGSLFPRLTDDIEVDGRYGPITHRYLMRFKNQLRATGTKLYPDAIMDPFRDNDPFSVGKKSHTEYAFGQLLRGASVADDESNLKKFDGLVEHEDTHPSLRAALTQQRDDARQYA